MNKIYILFCATLLLFSCKRDPQNVQPVWSGTNVMEGEWEMRVYNGDSVVSPMEGMLIMTPTSDTSGTADFNMTIDGLTDNVEHAQYDLKSADKKVYFSRIETGNNGMLVNGEVWKINKIILHDDNLLDTLEIQTDKTAIRMLFSKP